MKKIKVNFWCNAGHTEEIVTVKIYDNTNKDEDEQIQEEFIKWLDNNEDVGWDRID